MQRTFSTRAPARRRWGSAGRPTALVVLVAALATIAAACIPPDPAVPEVVVTAPSPTVAYGAEIPELTPTYGIVTPSVGATCTTTATQGSPAGSYPTTCSGASQAGHTVRYVAGTLTIAPAEVTVTASSGAMDFGDDAPAITATYSGLVGITEPEVLASCSTEATSTSSAGSYASTCEGASDPNHSFTYVDGTVTVGAVPVVVTASSATSVYGADAPEIQASYSGLRNGDTEPATAAECGTDATPASVVGTYTSSCADAADPNYTFTYVDGSVSVTPAPAVVTASSDSVAFGDEIPAITPSYSGLVNGDVAPATAPTCSTTATQGSASGTYASTCADAADPNYTFSYVDGTVTIVAGTAPVTLTASSATITYGDDAPEITASYDGFTGGQTEPATAPTCSTTATSSSPVGTYPSTCVGAADPNHVITVVNGTVTVLPAAATVTASSPSSAYGAPVAAVTPSYSGLVNGDVAPATAPVCSTDATSASSAGSYSTSCVGAADPNYTFSSVDGAYTVTPAAATVTASSATITEGDAIPEITASYSGLVNGDVAPATAATCSTTATSASAPGTYPTTCTGAADPNYSFTSVDGTLTVEAVVGPEPEPEFFGLAAYQASTAYKFTTLGATATATLPQGTIPVVSGTGAGFSTYFNVTVQTVTGAQQVFCNGASTTTLTTCTGGGGAMIPGGYVSTAPMHQFDVYPLVGGAAAVEPSSLTILEDVPAAARGMDSYVVANATRGLITYLQGGGATGEFTLTFGICDAGTATYSASDPTCHLGEIKYEQGAIARLGQRLQVSITTQDIYNSFPIAIDAPTAVDPGETFTLKWAPASGAMPARQQTLNITVNSGSMFTSYIPIPAGMTYVPGSAKLVGGDTRTSGVATIDYCTAAGGACDARLTGNWDGTTQPYLKLALPSAVTVPGGQQFSMPTIEAQFTATGASGTQANWSLTQHKVRTVTPLATVTFEGYPTESASGNPAKAAPRVLHTIGIN